MDQEVRQPVYGRGGAWCVGGGVPLTDIHPYIEMPIHSNTSYGMYRGEVVPGQELTTYLRAAVENEGGV